MHVDLFVSRKYGRPKIHFVQAHQEMEVENTGSDGLFTQVATLEGSLIAISKAAARNFPLQDTHF